MLLKVCKNVKIFGTFFDCLSLTLLLEFNFPFFVVMSIFWKSMLFISGFCLFILGKNLELNSSFSSLMLLYL